MSLVCQKTQVEASADDISTETRKKAEDATNLMQAVVTNKTENVLDSKVRCFFHIEIESNLRKTSKFD